ncbi:MAG: MBL fold metallo-hydrolase [Chlamydiae bacterium]|nr:MBL fold metallo-hydrolase [Chlamydiota bacterium]
MILKINRKVVISLIILCVVLWSGVFILRAKRLEASAFKLDQPLFLVLQLSVGQGDSMLLISPDHQVTLVDGGPVLPSRSGLWDAGKEVIGPILMGLGLSHIDTMIVTHHDQDHLGGFVSLLEHMEVGQVFDNGRSQTSELYKKFLNVLSMKHIPLEHLKEGDELTLGEHVDAQVLSPEAGEAWDSNDTSLVLRVTYGDFEMLLTGDIEASAERKICEDYGSALHCDFLKVPHHGSKTSSSSPFLRLVHPSMAGISVGKKNSYGHPAPLVLERYQKTGNVEVLRTDQDGGILLISDGGECILATEKGKFEKKSVK